MKKDILDKKFCHHKWFKGVGLTRRQAIEYFASNYDFSISQKLAIKQSKNLFDDLIYDYVLVCDGDRSCYRLTYEEYNYFNKRRKFWKEWYNNFKNDNLELLKNDWCEYSYKENESKLKVNEYKSYNDAFNKSRNK